MFYERTPLSYLIYAILVMSCIIIGLNKVEMCNMKTELKMQVFPCFLSMLYLLRSLDFTELFYSHGICLDCVLSKKEHQQSFPWLCSF